MAIDEFVESGKDHFRRIFAASTVACEHLGTANGNPFHRFATSMTIDGVSYIVERHVHLRTRTPRHQTGEASGRELAKAVVDALAGAFVFEFFHRADDADRLPQNLRKLVDTLRSRESNAPGKSRRRTGSTQSAASSRAPRRLATHGHALATGDSLLTSGQIPTT